MTTIVKNALFSHISGKSFMFPCTLTLTQIRERGYLVKPRLKNPSWFVKKNYLANEDLLTHENKNFVQEVVKEQYVLSNEKSLVKLNEFKEVEWSPKLRRTGVLARKIGQYPMWLKNGDRILTTLLQVVDNHVIKYIPPEQFDPPRKTVQFKQRVIKKENKLGCLLVGAENEDPSVLTKEYCGLFKDSGIMPKKHLARFVISPEAALSPGTPLNVTHFRVGDFVDVRGKTIDRGFQGVVKRWGFKGQPASHGVTKTHRRPGNIGGGGEKGRVWPGTKMPGHMGNRWRVLKGLKIWRMNTKYNVMWVRGCCIPGETNSLVYIYDTILPLPRRKISPPFPTSNFDDSEDIPEEILCEELHNFKDPSLDFKEESKAK
ncbi:39S ribosomal protein L3, mitochondrial [Condylostylus longicornis]|uniref:39S ribosomal protein L3, mitochondrial n=1 Tax=Condylostylus longicornis TaxID=2530218 RepID=UPI00244DBF8A|nr:39S ribosomal protein L3, mitochondrial [Condylostylus longicornis]